MINITYVFLLMFYTYDIAYSRPEKEVILSSGIGGWSSDQLLNQYYAYKTYSNMNIITTSSILAYYIEENGTLGVYNTGDVNMNGEQYQKKIRDELQLSALPCLYCDATIGSCTNLSSRLNNLYDNMDLFINDTITRALVNNWNGYSVDLEPDDNVDTSNVTNFIVSWSNALNVHNLYLSVWIGSDTPYNLTILYNSTLIRLITMDSYGMNYKETINLLAPIQTTMFDSHNLGFGLLTNYNEKQLNDEDDDDNFDLKDLLNWASLSNVDTISIWASHIPPEWYTHLNTYLYLHL